MSAMPLSLSDAVFTPSKAPRAQAMGMPFDRPASAEAE
eukprot:CAMPEP_0198520236 /NCGR_PEP_ID=MMETSP1462-20131121/20208_1 /TAXON_ID=1333877 /ORGANISM="Brandtodinium nutriculum, Strain RCC3387" /LENGTH=37 /DNA_ID= /DNA_START= /DNA_END= /DNA_ORIENTATION=